MSDSTMIDIHCHIAGIGAGESGCFVSPALRENWRYRVYLRSFGVTEAELTREGDALVVRRLSETLARSRLVSKAVVLAMDCVVGADGEPEPGQTEMYIPNAFAAFEARRYPNLLFGASVNPYRRDALEQLDKAVADGAVLIKWLPAIQLIDPADKRLGPFYRRLAEIGLPLLTHTGEEHSFTRAKNELGDPDRLRLPLTEGVTVIAAHAASNGWNEGERNFNRFLRLAASYHNLYADISALTQHNRPGQLERLLRHRGLYDRLLYGTDAPLINNAITSPWFHAFRLGPHNLMKILAEKNPWDRDVALKRALGVTDEILVNNARLLRVKFKSPG
jgi:predicted TIM-barrel fold metal-dependent hydrolase